MTQTSTAAPSSFSVAQADRVGQPLRAGAVGERAVRPPSSPSHPKAAAHGSTTVNGRLVTGMQGENVTYAPHSERCEIGTYAPASAGAEPAPSVSAPSVPATPTARQRTPVDFHHLSNSEPACRKDDFPLKRQHYKCSQESRGARRARLHARASSPRLCSVMPATLRL